VQAEVKYAIIKNMSKQKSFTVIDKYYSQDSILAKDLDIDIAGEIKIWRLDYKPSSLTEAHECYKKCGAVLLNKDFVLSNNKTVSEETGPVRNRLLKRWRQGQLDNLTKTKDYIAYNHTERHMRTIAYQDVCENLSEIISLQKDLLPSIKIIAGDNQTEISTDNDEGTVVNLQVFSQSAEASSKQQHGAHSDRVDTTAVVTIENIGPHGELVFIDNYAQSCAALNLEQHEYFNENLIKILKLQPQAIRFRVHSTTAGSIVIVRTDKDIHFITSKKSADVFSNITTEQKYQLQNKSQILGRGIINMAFETEHCRKVDRISKEIESKYDFSEAHTDYKGFFAKLDQALRETGLEKETEEAVKSAIITRVSAHDLYS